MNEKVAIEKFDPQDGSTIATLLKRNLEPFQDSDAALAPTFRRLQDLASIYSSPGCRLLVARHTDDGTLIACAGLGPLQGLPVSEGIGEIRDLVVEERMRGLGIGSRLLNRCIDEARTLGYRRLYLETSQNMLHARKLFLRTGFRPVTENNAISEKMSSSLPCYFLMENISDISDTH